MEQELNQQGITEEKPSTDIPTEEKAVSEPQDIERRIQSELDKRLAKIYQERDSYKHKAEQADVLQTQIQELETEISRMQDEAYRDDPDLLRDAKTKREMLKQQKGIQQREKELQEAQIALGKQMKALDIAELSQKYGVSAKVLERANAQNKSELEEFAREIQGELPKSEGKPKEKPVYDTGVSDVGGSTDDEFLKLYAAGKTDDHARAQKIMSKM